MKKNLLTNNIYNKNIKNIYFFDDIIYSKKFTHLISDSLFLYQKWFKTKYKFIL